MDDSRTMHCTYKWCGKTAYQVHDAGDLPENERHFTCGCRAYIFTGPISQETLPDHWEFARR